MLKSMDEYRLEEARLKLDEAYRSAMSNVLFQLASHASIGALLIPDVKEAAASFGRSHGYTMLAAGISSGVIPLDRASEALERIHRVCQESK